jgi:hypothetical protein
MRQLKKLDPDVKTRLCDLATVGQVAGVRLLQQVLQPGGLDNILHCQADRAALGRVAGGGQGGGVEWGGGRSGGRHQTLRFQQGQKSLRGVSGRNMQLGLTVHGRIKYETERKNV